jgi:ClpP class serine protease
MVEALAYPWAIDQGWLTFLCALFNDSSSNNDLHYVSNNQPNLKSNVIRIHGPILPRDNMVSSIFGFPTVESISRQLDQLKGKGPITLDIDSPGGHVTGISSLAEKIYSMRRQGIRAYVSGMAASAAYWLASAAKTITASDTSEVGSIGVVLSLVDDTKAMDNAGLKKINIVSSVSPLKVADPNAEYSYYQGRVDKISEVFVNYIAKYRGIKYNDVAEKYGKGGLVVAADAKRRGMIDGIEGIYKYGGYSMADHGDVPAADSTAEQLEEENKRLRTEVAQLHDQLKNVTAQERERIIKLFDVTSHREVLADAVANGKTAEVLAYEMIKRGAFKVETLGPSSYKAAQSPSVPYQAPSEDDGQRNQWNNALAEAIDRRKARGS